MNQIQQSNGLNVPSIPVIRIDFPAKCWKSVRTSLKFMPTEAIVTPRQVNDKFYELKIVAKTYNELLEASTEVWRQLALTQCKIKVIHDAATFDFVTSWTTDDQILFQNTYKASIMWQNTGSKLQIILKSWTNDDLKKAEDELKRMQSEKKFPTEAIESKDFRELRFAAMTDDDDLRHLPTDINIVVFGPTGAGKSLFINNMANCLKFKRLSNFETGGYEILIPAKFTFRKNGTSSVVVLPTNENDNNEKFSMGESSTQKCRLHTFAIPGKKEHRIRVIDTPGVGDTRGVKKDDENFEEIMAYLSHFPKIHAFVIVLKSTENRLTDTFKYHMNEMLIRFHRTVADNMIFCYTHAQSHNYQDGDIVNVLEPFVDNLAGKNINIALKEDTQYYFDSVFLKYVAGLKHGLQYTKAEREPYKNSFVKSKANFERLFKYIMTLPAHDVNLTLCINNTKKVIRIISEPLAKLTKTILENQEIIKKHKREIENFRKEQNRLESDRYLEQKIMTATTLETPKVVCSSPQCRTNMGYRTCHSSCKDKSVKNCSVMKKDICTVCNCAMHCHQLVKVYSEECTQKIRNHEMDQQIDNIQRESYIRADNIHDLNIIEKQLIFRMDTLKRICAAFAAFYAHHSLLRVNDVYIDYLELVKRNHQNEEERTSIEEFQKIYKEQVRLIDDAVRGGSQILSVHEINMMIGELQASDWCGEYLNSILYMSVNSTQRDEFDKSNKVVLSNWRENLDFFLIKPVKKLRNWLL